MKRPPFRAPRALMMPAFVAVLAGWLALENLAALGQSLRGDERAVADRLRMETIREVTVRLTDPDMEGRGTAQPGGAKAAKYLADRFAQLGLKPLGEGGTYLQAIAFQAVRVRPGSSLKIGDQALAWSADFLCERPKYPERETIEAAGELICVDGSAVPRDPQGRPVDDLKGKIAVAVERSPAVHDLARRGAAAILVALDRPALPSHLGEGGPHDEATLARPLPGMDGPLPPVVYLTRAASEKLFAKSPQTYADTLAKGRAGRPFQRELGQRAALSLRVTIEPLASHNVIGLLEGSDPRLKDEAVVYSAHYDAYGKDKEGRIRPGAADNALGVAKMLAVAEALAQAPKRPRRSVIFLAPTAEERGLLGARYWLEHPTWPVPKVAANLNFDGIDTETYGPLWALVVEGLGHSNLDLTVGAVARDLGLLPLPDVELKERAFFRSDHYRFALSGVPTIYVFGLGMPPQPGGAKPQPKGVLGALAGVRSQAEGLVEVQRRAHEFLAKRYHQPGDAIRPEWDWQGPRTAAVFYLLAGLRVANAEKMPEYYPKSPFNHPRGKRP